MADLRYQDCLYQCGGPNPTKCFNPTPECYLALLKEPAHRQSSPAEYRVCDSVTPIQTGSEYPNVIQYRMDLQRYLQTFRGSRSGRGEIGQFYFSESLIRHEKIIQHSLQVLNGHHPSELWREDLLNRLGTLAVAQISSMGNGDEEKSSITRWFRGERVAMFGNYHLSLSWVTSPDQCPSWSPPRPVTQPVEIDRFLFTHLLKKIEEKRESLTPQEMHFPTDARNKNSPEIIHSVLPGPYKSVPFVKGSDANSCAWGANHWQMVSYDPPLPLIQLEGISRLEAGASLCLRLSEEDEEIDQPLLQFALSKTVLNIDEEITLAVDINNATSVKVGPGLQGRELIYKSPLTITLRRLP